MTRSASENARSAEGAQPVESAVNSPNATSSPPHTSAGRGIASLGARSNATATRTPHQTRIAATLRIADGELPPSTATTTTREAMSSRGANWNSWTRGRRGPRSWFAIGRVAAPVVVLALLTILPPAATAAPVRDPAVEQYVESVPGTGGGGSTPENGRPSGGGELPAAVQQQIQQQGGADADALKAVGSSPALGAPRHRRAAQADLPHGPDRGRSSLGAAASAAVSGDGNAGGWLIAAIAALTVALAGTALARRALARG
jgi:hypothetical protein